MRSFRIRLAVAVLLPLLFGGMVRGDAVPAFLSAQSFPALRFDNLADYPDFDFYLLYFHGPGAPGPHLAHVQSGETIRLIKERGRIGGAYLLAVPHGTLPPSLNWRSDETPPRCLRSASLDGIGYGPGYLIPYQVKIANSKLEVMMQPSEWQPGVWSLQILKALPCVLVPIAFCVALAWFGVRIVRRLYSPKPANPASNP